MGAGATCGGGSPPFGGDCGCGCIGRPPPSPRLERAAEWRGPLLTAAGKPVSGALCGLVSPPGISAPSTIPGLMPSASGSAGLIGARIPTSRSGGGGDPWSDIEDDLAELRDWCEENPKLCDDDGETSDGAQESGTHTRPSDVFEVPPTEEWGSPSCAFHGEDSEADCQDFSPPREAPERPFDESVMSNVRVDGDCGAAFEDLIRHGWAFLSANSDILEWACCLLYGRAYRNRIVSRIRSTTRLPVAVHCDHVGDRRAAWTPSPCEPGGGLGEVLALSFPAFGMSLCEDTEKVERWVQLWTSSDRSENLCALVDCSSLLCHELTHIALTFRSGDRSATADGSIEESCARSHLTESIWRWAIYQRYPDALTAECCGGLSSDGTFMSGNPDSMSTRC